jgi:hypothetical protein
VYKVDDSTAREDVVSQLESNSSGFLELLIFLLPLSTARGRLRVENKNKIKSQLFQIISHESGV